MKKILAFLLCAAMLLSGMTAAAAEETYVGQAQGFGGLVTVTLTVADGVITACTAEGAGETAGIGSNAIEQLPAKIVEANSADVDAVAGATVTSEAIKTAAASAFKQASGETVDLTVKMAPGTYVGEGWGYSPAIKLQAKVMVDETSIVSIEVVEPHADTPEVAFTAIERLIPRIVEAQSVTIDAVTGATMTSNGIKEATADALKQALVAGGSSEEAIAAFYKTVEKSDKVVELEYDVVVVGMGAAGVGAAVSAAETAYAAAGNDAEQVSVLAIDKAGRFGGTSGLTSEPLGVNPEKFQNEFNNGKDYVDVAALKKDWLEYTHYDAKEKVLDKFLDQSGETIDWLTYNHGFEFIQPEGGLDGTYDHRVRFTVKASYADMSFFERWGVLRVYFEGMIDKYTEMGGDVMLETEGYELMYDEETRTIQGVKAKGYDGTTYVINADSVILATGGYMNNPEMMMRYMSNEYYPLQGIWPAGFNWSVNDGKMIQAAFDIGADSYNLSVPPMTHVGGAAQVIQEFPIYPNEGDRYSFSGCYTLNDIPNALTTGNPQALAVDTTGKRFTTEQNLLTFNPWIAGPNFYCLWSDAQIKDIEQNGLYHSDLVPGVGVSGWPAGKPVEGIYDVLDVCIEKGFAWKADTLEELAAMIGVPADALVETVAKYNAACEAGVDEAFGKDPQYLWALGSEGPYYCVMGASYAYGTCGALDVNEDINVLDWDGNVMNGLYACGLDSMGVLLSEKEAYVTFGGCAQGWAWTSGRLAGENAVNYALSK